jgi:hypothetical protein
MFEIEKTKIPKTEPSTVKFIIKKVPKKVIKLQPKELKPQQQGIEPEKQQSSSCLFEIY